MSAGGVCLRLNLEWTNSAEEYFLSFVRVISDDHERTGGPRI